MPPPPRDRGSQRKKHQKRQNRGRNFSTSAESRITGPSSIAVLSTYRGLLRATNPKLNNEPTRKMSRSGSGYKAIQAEYQKNRDLNPMASWKHHSDATELLTALTSNITHNQTLYDSGWLPARDTKKAVDSIAQRVGMDLPENTLAKDLYDASSYVSSVDDGKRSTGASLRKAFGDSTPFQDIFGSHATSGIVDNPLDQIRMDEAKRSVIESQQKQMEMLIKQQQDKLAAKKGGSVPGDVQRQKDTEDMIAKMIQAQEVDLLRKLKTKSDGMSKAVGSSTAEDQNSSQDGSQNGQQGQQKQSGNSRNTNNTGNQNEWDSAKAFADGRMFYNRSSSTWADNDQDQSYRQFAAGGGGGGGNGLGFGFGGLFGLLGFFDLASIFGLFWNSGEGDDDKFEPGRRPCAGTTDSV